MVVNSMFVARSSARGDGERRHYTASFGYRDHCKIAK